MTTYLLTWVQENWNWESFNSDVETILKNGRHIDTWSCGTTKKISPDDRFFLVKLGKEPKGIIASGWVRTSTVNYYERDSQAREVCINHFGLRCRVCKMDFEETYGDIGRGFIHVHHLKPLHEIGKEYKLKPLDDLRPVCPNCHAMLHKR